MDNRLTRSAARLIAPACPNGNTPTAVLTVKSDSVCRGEATGIPVSERSMPTTGRRHSPSRLGGIDVSLLSGDRDGVVSQPIPITPYVEFAEVCPEAIIDTAPDGNELGVWVLVDTGIDKDGDKYCSYEYRGGIV